MLHQILSAIIRGILAYILLIVLTRFMGRKMISQMTFFDFAVAVTLGALTADLAINVKVTLTEVVVLLAMAALNLTLGYINIKSIPLRKLLNAEPVVLVKNGQIVNENMEKLRYTIEDLNMRLRSKNVFNISNVEFAVAEIDGTLSVLPKSQKQPLTPADLNIPTKYVGLTKDLIIDGELMEENLRDAKLDEDWMKERLSQKGIVTIDEVFYAGLDTEGNLYVSLKILGEEKHGQYGIE